MEMDSNDWNEVERMAVKRLHELIDAIESDDPTSGVYSANWDQTGTLTKIGISDRIKRTEVKADIGSNSEAE
jgi:hypothetical protein